MPRTKVTARKLMGGHVVRKKKPTRDSNKRRIGGKPPQGQVKKKRRYRSGTVALREIRKYQTSTETLIPKLSFQRLVKEVMQNECIRRGIPMKKIQSPALLAIQCATEQYVTELFYKS